jgi:hypothetical protein
LRGRWERERWWAEKWGGGKTESGGGDDEVGEVGRDGGLWLGGRMAEAVGLIQERMD